MQSHIRILIFSLLLGLAPLTVATPAESAAAEFIQRQHLGRNLKTLASSAAPRTQTFAMMASKLGQAETQLLVSKELDACADQFQGQWNSNLAKIYARHFTPEELTSLTSEGRNSPYVNKLAAKQGVIGAEMQQLSTPILTAYLGAAMNGAFAKFSKR
jgi:hypothetical protein